jgi:hypothetical protein
MSRTSVTVTPLERRPARRNGHHLTTTALTPRVPHECTAAAQAMKAKPRQGKGASNDAAARQAPCGRPVILRLMKPAALYCPKFVGVLTSTQLPGQLEPDRGIGDPWGNAASGIAYTPCNMVRIRVPRAARHRAILQPARLGGSNSILCGAARCLGPLSFGVVPVVDEPVVQLATWRIPCCNIVDHVAAEYKKNEGAGGTARLGSPPKAGLCVGA